MVETGLLERLKTEARPVVVDVWAPWCLPCRAMAPALARHALQYEGQVALWKLNADELPEEAQALGVFGLPTLIAFRDGRELWRRTGALPAATIGQLFAGLARGQAAPPPGLGRSERLLRLAGGVALLGLAWATAGSWLLAAAGGVVLFSAVYDRCPLWRAITTHLKQRFARD